MRGNCVIDDEFVRYFVDFIDGVSSVDGIANSVELLKFFLLIIAFVLISIVYCYYYSVLCGMGGFKRCFKEIIGSTTKGCTSTTVSVINSNSFGDAFGFSICFYLQPIG